MPSPGRSSSNHGQSRNSSHISHSTSASHRDDVSQPSSRRRCSRSPSPRRSRPSRRRIPRKRFGLTVPEHRKYVGDFDFEEKYDEDPIYEELEPTGRVWRVFMDECEVFDNDMVTEARDGLDLFLVFAGLFSAVLTTFVAQTSQALSNNFAAVSTSLLLEIATLQRAQINGTSPDDIPISDMISGPSGFDIWVNALWFTSLALSLGTALTAVLVKQWLYQYMSMTSGTPRDRSLIRQYRFNGLRKWHVLTIISILPIILHIALGVFLIGLVVFLIPLNTPLACVVGFITALVYAVYIISNIMPILDTQCPFRTPFSDVLNVGVRQVRGLVSSAQMLAIRATRVLYESPPATTASSPYTVSAPPDICVTLKEAERIAATDLARLWENTFDALSWLFQSTSNIPTKHVRMQSIGPFPDDWSGQLGTLLKEGLEQLIYANLHDNRILPGCEHRVERLMRSYKHVDSYQSVFPFHVWALDDVHFEPPFHILASILMHRSSSGYISAHRASVANPRWYARDLLAHIVQHIELPVSVRLPSAIWRHLIHASYQHGLPYIDGLKANIQIFELALKNLFAPPTDPRDNVAVQIFDGSVPLWSWISFILLPLAEEKYMSLNSLQLRQLLVMHDYIFSRLQDSEEEVQTSLRILAIIWDKISFVGSLTPKDSRRVWMLAERIFTHPPFYSSSVDAFNLYCISILRTLASSCSNLMGVEVLQDGSGVVTPNTDFLTKLVAEFLSALKMQNSHYLSLSRQISSIWALSLQHDIVDAYILFHSSMPTFTRTPVSVFRIIADLYPLMSAFLAGLHRGAIPSAVITECTKGLCQPDSLFMTCQIVAIGSRRCDDAFEQTFRNLVSLVGPGHPSWNDRKRIRDEHVEWLSFPYYDERLTFRLQYGLDMLDKILSLESEGSLRPGRVKTVDNSEVGRVSLWARVRCMLPSWMTMGIFIVLTRPSLQIHLASPHPMFDFYTPDQAVTLFQESGAKNLLISGRYRSAYRAPTTCIPSTKSTTYYTTDPTHDVNEPFNIASKAIHAWQYANGGCPSASCAFIQLHGKASTSCSAVDMMLSSELAWYLDATDTALEHGVKKLVYTATASVVYDGTDQNGIDETLPYPEQAFDDYNETKAISEKAVLQANGQGVLKTTSLRVAGLFGTRDRGTATSFLKILAEGRHTTQLGPNKVKYDWTFIINAAQAHLLAADRLDPAHPKHASVAGETFFITNGEPWGFWDLSRALWAGALRKPART